MSTSHFECAGDPLLFPLGRVQTDRPQSGRARGTNGFAGVSDVALGCQTVECQLLRRANLRNRPIAVLQAAAADVSSAAIADVHDQNTSSRSSPYTGPRTAGVLAT